MPAGNASLMDVFERTSFCVYIYGVLLHSCCYADKDGVQPFVCPTCFCLLFWANSSIHLPWLELKIKDWKYCWLIYVRENTVG